MERVRLTPPGEKRARGGRARLYVRWMPHLGAEAVALYELLRILPELGNDAPEIEELAELLRSTPEGVEASLEALIEARFVVRWDGWLEVAEHPPSAGERPREDEHFDRDGLPLRRRHPLRAVLHISLSARRLRRIASFLRSGPALQRTRSAPCRGWVYAHGEVVGGLAELLRAADRREAAS